MAELNTGDGGGKHGKHGKKRAKKSSTKIDMTPMVDLAFLLLTFFMLTTTFSKPKTMEINMPADLPPEIKPPKINNALTFLLSESDAIYYYYGEFKPEETKLEKTDFSKDGLHKILLTRNDYVINKIEALQKQKEATHMADTTFKRLSVGIKGEKQSLMALVKTDDKATYRNVVDMLDELNICYIGKYALVDASPPELEMIKKAKN